jgi:hypothetical protein
MSEGHILSMFGGLRFGGKGVIPGLCSGMRMGCVCWPLRRFGGTCCMEEW